MKKLLALMVVLCGMFALTGCVKIEQYLPEVEGEEDSILSPKWESFIFKSLTDNENLVVERTPAEGGRFTIATSPYERNKYVGLAVYSTDCESCKMHAKWLDKLAGPNVGEGALPADLYGMDYLIIFVDKFDNADAEDVAWVKNLSHVKAYTNVAAVCEGGACRKAFAPFTAKTPEVATMYYIDKSNLARTRQGITWNTTDDQKELFKAMWEDVAKYLNLQGISFDVNVEGWSEGADQTVKI